MPNKNDFPHLPLPLKYKDRAYLTGGGTESDQTKANKNNRPQHGEYIKEKAKTISRFWHERIDTRETESLPSIPKDMPLLLEIDPNVDSDFLRSTFGFEIVSEEDEGFVIVSTQDLDLSEFLKKINGFVQGAYGTSNVAKIHKLYEDENFQMRLEHLLSEDLLKKWDLLKDDIIYIVDIGIECLGTIVLPNPVKKNENESTEKWEKRFKRYQEKKEEAYIAWDNLKMEREEAIERFVDGYGGEVLSLIDNEDYGSSKLPDSFTARIRINGKGLRDLVLNFPYIFEVSEPEKLFHMPDVSLITDVAKPVANIVPPDKNSPKVCVIDSGIQEQHILINSAIDNVNSHCYLPGITDVSDYIKEGGHGTRIAGAVLYSSNIPKSGTYQLPCWIQNARVIDENGCFPDEIFPPNLLEAIIKRYFNNSKTRIYNHSIAGYFPCRLKRMSAWAAAIDLLNYEYDILFIQAVGNIQSSSTYPTRLGIREHLQAGRVYPDYLLENSCRLPNPSQSLQALTVGSICEGEFQDIGRQSLGKRGWPSAFSTTGPGIWDVIKPDIVEYGGSFVRDTGNPPNFTYPPEVCPELVRTSPPGPLYDRDGIGTSFAAPKVAHIAAQLQLILPNEPCLLYRALIVQSARWPDWANNQTNKANILRHFGYGLPDLQRALNNNLYRVTLITSGRVDITAREVHVYKVPIPESIREPGQEYDVKIEVTLSCVAKPRRTRKKLRGYLSTWVDWKTSKRGETPESFANRVLFTGNRQDTDGEGTIPWEIGNQVKAGIEGLRRNAGTLQKDWATIKSHQLPNEFCIAVVGHPGWDKDPDSKAFYSLAISFEVVNQEIEIYELIRSEIEAEVEIEIGPDV